MPDPQLRHRPAVAAAIRPVHDGLAAMYGRPRRAQPRGSVLDGLVATILSQNTTNANSGRAFRGLKHRFPDWDAVRTAGVRSIEASIRSGGLARTKSRRIKAILRTIRDRHGATSLEHLRGRPDEEVRRELAGLPGVGPKTISCVLLFALGRDDFPVDTHVHRVARRLGWVPGSSSRERTYETLNGVVPRRLSRSLHLLMVRHGQETCRAGRPRCSRCAVAPHCAAFARGGTDGSTALDRHA